MEQILNVQLLLFTTVLWKSGSLTVVFNGAPSHSERIENGNDLEGAQKPILRGFQFLSIQTPFR